jgi:glutamate transport system permease protein
VSTDAVLYDHPGPRAKIRNTTLTVVFGILLLLLIYWIYRKFDDKAQWAGPLWKPFTQSETWTEYLLPGLWATISAAAVAWCCRWCSASSSRWAGSPTTGG